MHIKLDLEALTLDDLEILDDARSNPGGGMWKAIRVLLARFAYESPNGTKMEYDKALREVGKLSMKEALDLMADMGQEMEKVAKAALPPQTDGT